MTEKEIKARADAERLWQTLKLFDSYHNQLQQQFALVSDDELVRSRLVEFGLLDRVEKIAAMRGVGI